MPTARRPRDTSPAMWAALILVAGSLLVRPTPACAQAPLVLMDYPHETCLVDLDALLHWDRPEGYDLKGPVKSASETLSEFTLASVEPLAFEPVTRTHEKPPVIEFDERGRITRLQPPLRVSLADPPDMLPGIRSEVAAVVEWVAAGDSRTATWTVNGELLGLVRQTTDAHGRLVRSDGYDSRGAPIAMASVTYDASGHEATVSFNGASGRRPSPTNVFDKPNSTTYTLSLHEGRVMSYEYMTVAEHRSPWPKHKIEAAYEGNTAVVRAFEDGHEEWSQQITFNDEGDIVEIEQFLGANPYAHFKYQYEYDAHGNWIRRTDFALISRFGNQTFEPILRTDRAIAYYDASAPKP